MQVDGRGPLRGKSAITSRRKLRIRVLSGTLVSRLRDLSNEWSQG